MASVGGVSGGNTVSSLMNSANMISGLASGLDTEGMIESLVKSYQTKISQLNQKVTKTEWKQDAYRSIIQKMVGFSSKYTSYTSNTNLMSSSFFSSAVKVLTKGAFADKVSASGHLPERGAPAGQVGPVPHQERAGYRRVRGHPRRRGG